MKRKQSKAAIAAAVQALTQSHENIFAVEQVGEWLTQVKEADGICVRYTLEILCGGLNDCYCEAMDAIAHLKHPATALLLKACESLDVIKLVANDRDGNLSRAELCAISRVVLTFLGESVRWMEQAAEALGEKPHGFGWLDCLQHVEGLPEGEFKRLDVQQQWVASYFGQLNSDNRANVAGLISELVKSQK